MSRPGSYRPPKSESAKLNAKLRHARYLKRHPARRVLSNKLNWLKHRYGEEAKEYFLANRACERCGEDRIACLAIHHPHGKRVKKFETICHNDHAVHHGNSFTMTDCRK